MMDENEVRAGLAGAREELEIRRNTGDEGAYHGTTGYLQPIGTEVLESLGA
jgi:hypothetical protein